MKNLGRIILFLSILKSMLFGGVSASLDSRVVYQGEMVTYSLIISGSDVQKPTLESICGNEILSTSSQTSIESINGSYSKSYTLSYQFMPKSSCTIEPVEVNVDGKIERSNAVELLLKSPSDQKNIPFMLTLETPKKSLYVGEPFEVKLTIKQSLHAQAVDSKFIVPEFPGFWLKSQSEPQRVDDGEFITTTLSYKLAPQREGNLTVGAAQLQIASRSASPNSWGSFSPQVKWRAYYSNELEIQAKALPNNATLIGDFTIRTEVSQNEIYPNEALNVTVVVEGAGNLEDIKSFKPYVENVNVFDEKIEVKEDKLTQKLAFVADANYSVPAFELIFFSTKTSSLQKIQTQPIAITVHGAKEQEKLEIKREEGDEESTTLAKQTDQKEQSISTPLAFVLGLILGILLSSAFVLFKPTLVKKISKNELNLKDEKLLLVKLLPFKEDADVEKMMESIEANIYSKKKKRIDKKLLKEILKRHNIS